ncbi:hypothetical protein EEB19_19405 [Gordonia sp. OPL2]|nr:hypothetical protein EEB19_19405 [Gordonia sp. OPL2]
MLSPRRWPITKLFSRNPVVRRSDRVEALAFCLAALLAVLAIPLAVSVEGGVHKARSAAIAEQARTIHAVEATAVDDASVIFSEGQNGALVTARWSYNAVPHRGTVNVDDTALNAGDQFTMWVDEQGQTTRKPLTPADAASGAIMTAAAFYLAVLAVSAVAVMGVRGLLDRHRRRGWDSALAELTGSDDGHSHRHW